MTLSEIKDYLVDHDMGGGAIVFEAPDYASAFVGTSEDGRAIYSYALMIESLMKEDDMNSNEAVEFVEFNTINSLPSLGEKAPIIMYEIDDA